MRHIGGRGRSTAHRVRRELAAFPRQFWVLSTGVLILTVGIHACFPFETSYLTQELGVPISTVGLVLGVPILATLPLHILGGAFTDRYGRKAAMLVGVIVIMILYATFALAPSLWQITVAVVLEAAFGWALFLTGSNAMVADVVALGRRAEAYGFTRVAMHIGMAIGPLLASLLLSLNAGFRPLFLVGLAFCALFVILTSGALTDTRPPTTDATRSFRDALREYAGVLRDGRFFAFCAAALLPLYGFGQIWSTLPVALHQTQHASPRTWSLLLSTYAVTVALVQYPLIRILRSRDHLGLMAACCVLLCGGLAAAPLVPLGAATVASMVVAALGVMILVPISSTVAAGLAPRHLRGRYMGTWTLAQMGGYALGPTFGGWALAGLGPARAAVLTAACGGVGALSFLGLRSRLGRLENGGPETTSGGVPLTTTDR